MTRHETTTESQRTVTPNCRNNNDLGAALDSAMGTPAELAEIDENLLRAELSPAQRAAVVSRRKEIWEALHPFPDKLSDNAKVSKRGIAGEGRPVSFASDTQEKTGENERDTRRHISRAEALGPDLHAVVGTSLDKGVELDALKELSPDERRELIDAYCTRQRPSATNAEHRWRASAVLAGCPL